MKRWILSTSIVVLTILCCWAGTEKSRTDSAKAEATKATQQAIQARAALQAQPDPIRPVAVMKQASIELVSVTKPARVAVGRATKRPRALTGKAVARRVIGQHPLSVKYRREIRITLSTQELVVNEDSDEVFRFPCSTSANGLILPLNEHPDKPHDHVGLFHIKSKEPLHHSMLHDIDMPWALHYHGGHYIHATQEVVILGQPASHGCIRLSPTDARTLYNWAHIGDAVVVTR